MFTVESQCVERKLKDVKPVFRIGGEMTCDVTYPYLTCDGECVTELCLAGSEFSKDLCDASGLDTTAE